MHIRRGRSDAIHAYCPDLPGCSASAQTDQEALELLRQRVRDYFEAEKQEPLAAGTRRVTLEV